MDAPDNAKKFARGALWERLPNDAKTTTGDAAPCASPDLHEGLPKPQSRKSSGPDKFTQKIHLSIFTRHTCNESRGSVLQPCTRPRRPVYSAQARLDDALNLVKRGAHVTTRCSYSLEQGTRAFHGGGSFFRAMYVFFLCGGRAIFVCVVTRSSPAHIRTLFVALTPP